MAWVYILLADVFEIAWPFVLKWSVAFSKWAPLIGVVFSIPVMFLLAESVKLFGESANAGRVCCLLLILIGVIGLKLFSGSTG